MRINIGQFVVLKRTEMNIGSDAKDFEIARAADSSAFYHGHVVL